MDVEYFKISSVGWCGWSGFYFNDWFNLLEKVSPSDPITLNQVFIQYEINELSWNSWWKCVILFCSHVLKSILICYQAVGGRVEEISGVLKHLWYLMFEPVKGNSKMFMLLHSACSNLIQDIRAGLDWTHLTIYCNWFARW